MKCYICENDQKLKFLSEYKLEINEDHKYFENAKIFRCEDCQFSFVDPMLRCFIFNKTGNTTILLNKNLFKLF